ncbi:hypothetical protein PGT21_011725 [Puccinia graminis f. sp. tritici]|uniref:Uncharacterized protein n=1 Tax=Puccinia graminis f. sp. tritici TaxID=56615 RepID=A0A5B0NRS7_PUCGR|nr:hypothetical protein PGTUg99_014014 [Puccinia graminis f. sp. tritici]KAA1099561.1 hypothetical protein PGT21_011725 [Puccinia graminis f. sp. tritici]
MRKVLSEGAAGNNAKIGLLLNLIVGRDQDIQLLTTRSRFSLKHSKDDIRRHSTPAAYTRGDSVSCDIKLSPRKRLQLQPSSTVDQTFTDAARQSICPFSLCEASLLDRLSPPLQETVNVKLCRQSKTIGLKKLAEIAKKRRIKW